jgi:hypothetical protein
VTRTGQRTQVEVLVLGARGVHLEDAEDVGGVKAELTHHLAQHVVLSVHQLAACDAANFIRPRCALALPEQRVHVPISMGLPLPLNFQSCCVQK